MAPRRRSVHETRRTERKVAKPPMRTSATTTAPEPKDDKSAEDMQAFYGTGTGPALHYHLNDQPADKEQEEGT